MLQRYINRNQIEDLHQPVYGQLFTNEDLKILDDVDLVPQDPNILNGQKSELHIYSFYGDYILGDHNASHIIWDQASNSFLVNIRETFKEASITRGSYVIAINVFQEIWGSFEFPSSIVREISADRTEIKFSLYDKTKLADFNSFKSKIQELTDNNILNNLVVNFGFNRIQKILKIKYDAKDPTIFYVKLYLPIYDEINEKDTAWFSFEVIDPYIDSILLTSLIDPGQTQQIRGPNWRLDVSQWTSNATTYKSWEDILDANLSTQQRIIETALSSSGVARLNIDYTDFENFIFYSSAEERLRNFHYKISKVEEYSGSISTLLNTTASNTIFISASIDINQNRINEITSNLDPFEQWLYYNPTASIFSHDTSGSLTPWPKFLYNGAWKPYSVSHSLSQTWYNNNLASASAYDADNHNRLYWAIPEHIIMDEGNSNFITFVDMVGNHFDILYSYIKAMPQIHERDEHPERGASKDLLWHIAKSFGWQLQNTRQLGDLWNYKLGYNDSGSYEHTGSLFQISGEDQTFQIWRRTINNLPYLLKTKGTSRSVKALLSIYGIPDTLLSIKEYGGPTIQRGEPGLVENKFHYALNFTGSNYVTMSRQIIPASSGSWSGVTRVPDTTIFSFATDYSSSYSMSLWGIQNSDNDRLAALNLIHYNTSSFSASYSGSYQYGKIQFQIVSGSTFKSIYSDWYPFYNDDYWTVMMKTSNPILQGSTNDQIQISWGQASDCGRGTIIFTGSMFYSSSASGSAAGWGSYNATSESAASIFLGGITRKSGQPGSDNRFVGRIKAYKEYFSVLSDSIFNEHILNPSAYHDNSETGSYYNLYRYYPLGIDVQRWDHTVYTSVSSSHPNRKASFGTTASFVNFTGTQATQYTPEKEVEFVYVPSLGDYPLYGQKIRLEDNELARDLSLTGRSEKSQYDKAALDSNRLAIVFSQNDYVNRDIFNHSGQFELDEFVGDPGDEYEEGYPDLARYRQQYFQKYQQRNDINAFIRILAAYDYTFFEQIKQVVPARADLIDGILIEDHVLHRNKVRLTKRPTVENPQYETNIGYSTTESGEYLTWEATASQAPKVRMTYDYLIATASFPINLQMTYNYITGSLSGSFVVISAEPESHPNTDATTGLEGSASVYPNPYSGSQSVTQSIIDHYPLNCCYKKVVYHYSASGTFGNAYLREWRTAVSMSYGLYYSRSLECTDYQYAQECSTENEKRFRGSKISGPDFNVDSTETVDGGPVVTWWEVNPNSLEVFDNPNGGNLIIR